MKNRIEKALRKALLEEGEMSYELYEFDLEEGVNFLTDGLHEDDEDYVLALFERDNSVAMLLITKSDEVLINEKARDKLKMIWKEQYVNNFEKLMPDIIDQLSDGIIPNYGITIIK